MVTKRIDMTLEIDNVINKVGPTNIKVFSGDWNAVDFAFTLIDASTKKRIAVEGLDHFFVVTTEDESKFQMSDPAAINLQTGKITYSLPKAVLRHPGKALGQLTVADTQGRIGSIIFSFQIEQSLIDRVTVAEQEFYIHDFETLRAKFVDLYADAEIRKDQLFNDFMTWWNNVQTYLDGDTAAKLSSDVALLKNNLATLTTEVTNARTAANDGLAKATLKARIDADYNALIAQIGTVQANVDTLASELHDIYRRLSDTNEVVHVYISNTEGNDSTADGTEAKPFRTIQKAIDYLPYFCPWDVVLNIKAGTYLEDVRVMGKYWRSVEFNALGVPTNYNVQTTDSPVKLRQIAFRDFRGYIGLRVITFVDSANAPGFPNTGGVDQTSTTRGSILADRTGYIAIDRCRFTENTKSMSDWEAAITMSNSTGAMYNNYIANAKLGVKVGFSSTYRIGNLYGANNAAGIAVHSSVLFGYGTMSVGSIIGYTGGKYFTGTETFVAS